MREGVSSGARARQGVMHHAPTSHRVSRLTLTAFFLVCLYVGAAPSHAESSFLLSPVQAPEWELAAEDYLLLRTWPGAYDEAKRTTLLRDRHAIILGVAASMEIDLLTARTGPNDRFEIFLYPDEKTKVRFTRKRSNVELRDYRIHVLDAVGARYDERVAIAALVLRRTLGPPNHFILGSGLPRFLSGEFRGHPLDAWAAFLVKSKRFVTPGELADPRGIARGNPLACDLLAGSLAGEMLAHLGPRKVAQIWKERRLGTPNAYRDITGESFESFGEIWDRRIRTIRIPGLIAEEMEKLYREESGETERDRNLQPTLPVETIEVFFRVKKGSMPDRLPMIHRKSTEEVWFGPRFSGARIKRDQKPKDKPANKAEDEAAPAKGKK